MLGGHVEKWHIPSVCSSGQLPEMSTQHPGTSLHVTSFTRPSHALVLQATNTGVRRPGYTTCTLLFTLKMMDPCNDIGCTKVAKTAEKRGKGCRGKMVP